MPPFPAGRLRTRPLPALLQLPLSHGHDSDPCALSSLVTHGRWLVWHFFCWEKWISGDVSTPAAGWATVTGLSPQKQHREEGAWLTLMLPAASGLGHHHTSWVLYSGAMPPLLRWFCRSTRPNPPTVRGTDVWLSRGSSCAGQRILCWAMGVPVTHCGLTGGNKGRDSGCHSADSAFPVRGRAFTKGC